MASPRLQELLAEKARRQQLAAPPAAQQASPRLQALLAEKERRLAASPGVTSKIPVGAGEAALLGGLSGITLGASRDIGADIGAFGIGIADLLGLAPEALEDKTFLELQQLARKTSREKETAAREQQPLAFGLSEAGGSLALPFGGGARGIKQLAGLGTVTGGITAAAQTKESAFEDPIEFAKDVFSGAGIGGITGGLVAGVFGGIANKLTKKAAKKGFTKSELVVVNALRKEGLNDQQIASFASEAGKGHVPKTIGELADSSALLGRQKRLAQAAGDAGDVFKDFTEKRTAVIEKTVRDFIKDDISVITSPTRAGAKATAASTKAFKNLIKKRTKKTESLYVALYPKTIPENSMAELLKDPVVSSTLIKVRNTPALQRGLADLPDNSIGVLDRVKQDIDQQITQAIGRKQGTTVRGLQGAKVFLTNSLDRISPSYALVRQTFEKGSRPIDRLNETVLGSIANLEQGNFAKAGSKFFNETADEIRISSRILRKVNPEAADSLVAAKLTDLMDKSTTLPVLLNKMSKNEFILNKFRASMTPKQFAGFNRLMGEIQQATKVKFGSDTASNIQIDRLLTEELGTPLAEISGRVGFKQQLEDKAGRVLKNVFDKFQNKNFGDLARLMTGDGAEELAEKLSRVPKGTNKSLQVILDFLDKEAPAALTRGITVGATNE